MHNLIFRPFYKLITKILFRLGYRFVEIPMVIRGIGHQIVEPSILIKRQQLGLIPPHFKFVIFFSRDLTYSGFNTPHTNYPLIKYLKKYFKTIVFEHSDSLFEKIKFRLLAPFLYPGIYGVDEGRHKNILKYPIHHYMAITDQSAAMFETNDLHRKPLFHITKKDEAYGKRVQKKFGLKEKDWFVTFHYRDNVFYKEVNYWEKNYSNRCVDVDSYYEACKEVIARGGWCFRIAAKKSSPLPDKFKALEKVIDITDLEEDVDMFSVYLLAKCRFFLGCNSGPSIIPGFFGVPTVQVQTAPFYGAPIHHFDLFIFKKYYHLKKKRCLSLKEMFTHPYVHIRLDEDFQENEIELQDNTSEEIVELVSEMLDRLDGKEALKKSPLLFRDIGNPDAYCFKACSQLGKKFLASCC